MDPDNPRRNLPRLVALIVPIVVAGFAGEVPVVQPATVGVVLVGLIMFVGLIVLAAVAGDRAAGWFATLGAVVGYDYFLAAPRHSLMLEAIADVEFDVAILLVGVAVTEIVQWGRRARSLSSRRGTYLRDLAGVHAGESRGDLQRRIGGILARLLDADDVVFLDVAPDPEDAAITPEDRLRVGDHEWDAVDGLPTDRYVAAVVHKGERTVGHFRISSATHISRPTREQLSVAALLAQQLVTRADDAAQP